jgi:hypothetical protein
VTAHRGLDTNYPDVNGKWVSRRINAGLNHILVAKPDASCGERHEIEMREKLYAVI